VDGWWMRLASGCVGAAGGGLQSRMAHKRSTTSHHITSHPQVKELEQLQNLQNKPQTENNRRTVFKGRIMLWPCHPALAVPPSLAGFLGKQCTHVSTCLPPAHLTHNPSHYRPKLPLNPSAHQAALGEGRGDLARRPRHPQLQLRRRVVGQHAAARKDGGKEVRKEGVGWEQEVAIKSRASYVHGRPRATLEMSGCRQGTPHPSGSSSPSCLAKVPAAHPAQSHLVSARSNSVRHAANPYRRAASNLRRPSSSVAPPTLQTSENRNRLVTQLAAWR
jgi:hypothetical protein